MNKGTDIIIPVYNAYEDLTKCIASIWRYTDLSTHRVIIVNDCSPDERISPYIHSIEGDGIVVIENEKNVGFSGSVNRGIRYSVDKDVLLLNSDTIVTPNWIEKILKCAYSEGTIGTVTPLSNSATLASVPIAFQDNPIPENVTINEFADLMTIQGLLLQLASACLSSVKFLIWWGCSMRKRFSVDMVKKMIFVIVWSF